MNQCQNCGQTNNYGSNFCRFCGTRIVMVENQNQPPTYEHKPPRPYVWKTDEFQVQENQARRTQQIKQVQPIANLAPPQVYGAQQMSHYQAPQMMGYGYRCPSCGTQNYPRIERKISPAGWIVFTVLLVMFFPLFWVGFLIKEDVKVCPICGLRAG